MSAHLDLPYPRAIIRLRCPPMAWTHARDCASDCVAWAWYAEPETFSPQLAAPCLSRA